MKELTVELDLSVSRNLEFFTSYQIFTASLFSSDLSGDTTFTLQGTLDETNWFDIEEAGTAVTGTLSDDTVWGQSFESDKHIRFRFVFDGATTGNITLNLSIRQ